MNCKICYTPSSILFSKKVLRKYDVKYYKCSNCNFIQTENPYWLEEAYSNAAINALDVGAVGRNLYLSEIVARVINKIYSNYKECCFLDYGGATGLFTRLMRDKGYPFFHTDKYAQNVYVKNFELENIPNNKYLKAVTAFEVFEHLENPIEEISKLFEYADTIIFSTQLQPLHINNLENWWYFIPETGQHISLYHINTFEYISKKMKLSFYTNGSNFHILSKVVITKNISVYFKPPFYKRLYDKLFNAGDSLNNKDFQDIKQKLSFKHE